MSQSKELVIASSADFVTELLPSAQRTALLYHLSYLGLAKFPKLERVLRERDVQTQLLFGSSEALLLKCAATSKNLVTTLLPALKVAVEKDKTILAIKSLEKARAWITEIVVKVEQMVERYDKQNQSVATCTSDVILVKAETVETDAKILQDIQALKGAVLKEEEKLKKNTEEIKRIDEMIALKNQELQNYIRQASGKRNRLGFLTALVPFVGALVNAIFGAKIDAGLAAKIQAVSNELSRLSNEKSNLKNLEWSIHVRLTNNQLELARKTIERKSIPNPVHLNDVQTCLTRIQQILIQIQKFWESVSVMLEALKEETFANEHFIEDSEMKDIFLEAIVTAQQHWKAFGESCLYARGIFSLQSKNAYKFLEISPSSLSEDEWKEQYNAVIVQLNKISPDPFTPSARAAISNVLA
ncbi:uncharacterized protein LOC107749525 [Sinocyclocheilus rhinocerous]|uniref:uncharacterized protein LOC107749525 n=1 Tax=Sinocyclocheilus rhinocerous TaxID=307959 RepID=UPI0007B83BD6|nr:PREDICTED: uncharacterized protein LOC107749525 [Sinocyclocheilus rhinocerous]